MKTVNEHQGKVFAKMIKDTSMKKTVIAEKLHVSYSYLFKLADAEKIPDSYKRTLAKIGGLNVRDYFPNIPLTNKESAALKDENKLLKQNNQLMSLIIENNSKIRSLEEEVTYLREERMKYLAEGDKDDELTRDESGTKKH